MAINTIEVRSLLEEKQKNIQIPDSINDVFHLWKNIFEKKSRSVVSEIDIFYAGFMLANPSARDRYIEILRTEEHLENEKKKNDTY